MVPPLFRLSSCFLPTLSVVSAALVKLYRVLDSTNLNPDTAQIEDLHNPLPPIDNIPIHPPSSFTLPNHAMPPPYLPLRNTTSTSYNTTQPNTTPPSPSLLSHASAFEREILHSLTSISVLVPLCLSSSCLLSLLKCLFLKRERGWPPAARGTTRHAQPPFSSPFPAKIRRRGGKNKKSGAASFFAPVLPRHFSHVPIWGWSVEERKDSGLW
ncbi:hypothetical protein V8C44DRAFT_238133 [Trichoderma aethiopicum]